MKWRWALAKRSLEKLAASAWCASPVRWRNAATALHMGWLVVEDPRLHEREVPSITVQEFMEAMKLSEGRA